MVELDLIKIKNFCSSTKVTQKMKRQATNWEKNIYNTCDKGFLFRVFQNSCNWTIKKSNKNGQKLKNIRYVYGQ